MRIATVTKDTTGTLVLRATECTETDVFDHVSRSIILVLTVSLHPDPCHVVCIVLLRQPNLLETPSPMDTREKTHR